MIEKLDKYYVQRITILIKILDDEPNTMVSPEYVKEKLIAIMRGTFNTHPALNNIFLDLITNQDFKEIKKQIKLLGEL